MPVRRKYFVSKNGPIALIFWRTSLIPSTASTLRELLPTTYLREPAIRALTK